MKIPIVSPAALGKVVRASRKAQRIRQDDAAGSIGCTYMRMAMRAQALALRRASPRWRQMPPSTGRSQAGINEMRVLRDFFREFKG